MRCVECEKEPVSETRHCVCCGRELAQAEPPAIVEVPPVAAKHCRVCGASTSDGEFCAGCLGSFSAWAVAEPAVALAPAAPQPPPAPPAPPVKTPMVDSLWSELMKTPAPPEWSDPDPGQKQAVESTVAQTPAVPPVAHAPAVAPVPPTPAVPPVAYTPAIPPAAYTPVIPPVALAPAIPRDEPAKLAVPEAPPVEPIKIELEPVKVPALAPIPAAMPTPPARSASKPSPVSSGASAAPSSSRGVWMAAAAVVVLAAGLGGYWMKVHGWFSPRQITPITVAKQEPAPMREPQPAPQVAKPVIPAPAEPPKPVKARAAATTAPRKSPAPSNARAASAPAPAPIPAAQVSLPVATATLVEAPAPVAPAPAPAAPSGPIFEPTQVNEPPRVATRVEPSVPADLRGRALNEIVIVRMLVSPSGHPSRVSVLRKSKTGPRLDEAVIAAVSQWTFSPAKRRGEVVSCWFNMGVPVMAN